MADDLVQRLSDIPAGTKVTLILGDIFGQPFDYRVTTCGEVRQHGYYTEGGGWGLYKCKTSRDVECHEITVRPYKKRGNVRFKIGYKVLDYRMGWGQDDA